MKYQINKHIGIVCLLLLGTTLASSCNKLLDEKPDKSTVIISSLKDLQALLDDPGNMNGNYGPLAVVGGDEYYISTSTWSSSPLNERKAYIWDQDALFDVWLSNYIIVYHANTVLQELKRVKGGSQADRDYIRGQALFFRAFTFYNLAQVYCRPFSPTADTDPGIPLRMVPDVEEKTVRATVAQTYSRIIEDLNESIDLLPEAKGTINRPCRLASYAMLARTYLSMGDFGNAEKFANLYLRQSPGLMDFNTLNTLANPGIPHANAEVIFLATMDGSLTDATAIMDSTLFTSYHENDLRQAVFFKRNPDGTVYFKGSFEGTFGYRPFCGLATDEMYLIRAECRARSGRFNEAMDDLNTLLITRWKSNKFIPFVASNAGEALAILLKERRKELIFRGTRWTDLRRLNLEGANIHLKRIIDGTTYTLPANDKRWVWLIPKEVITLAGIPQNER